MFSVQPSCTIAKLKDYIVSETGASAACQVIIYKDKLLDDTMTISQCNIEKNGVLSMKALWD
jgi:nicotinamide mononucleotide (NMN) deamidase PncC